MQTSLCLCKNLQCNTVFSQFERLTNARFRRSSDLCEDMTMIQTTQVGTINNEQNPTATSANIFMTCTLVGAVVGSFLAVQIVSETLGSLAWQITLTVGFGGATVGGVSGLLTATLADVIFGGRLEEDFISEEY